MGCIARLSALVTISVVSFQVIAFVPFKNTSGTEVSWNTIPINYAINRSGTTDVPGTSEFDAVRAAFATWNAIANSDLEFIEAASLTTAEPAMDADGVSVVGWIEDASNELVAAVDVRAGTICFGPANVDCTESTSTEISEADIFFDGVHYTWTAEGNGNFSSSRGPHDIQGILTHEIGHMAGLEHVVTEGNTLYPFTFEGSIEWRNLSQDEISFAQATYPSAGAPAESSISGRVTRSGAVAVPGAYVVAIRGDGNVVGAIADSNGDYTIRRVPPGAYYVRVLPHTTDSGIMDGSSFYRSTSNVDVDFLAEFYQSSAETDQAAPTNPPAAQSVSVTAGNTTSGIDFEVSATGSVEDTLEVDDPATSARGPVNKSGAQELHHSCTETVPNTCDTNAANLDEDWVKFQAQQDAVYIIETFNVGLSVATGDLHGRTFLQLFSTTDTVNPLTLCPQFSGNACQNSSRNTREENPRSLVAYQETATGATTRLIKSRQADARKVGAGAYFDLSITELVGPFPVPIVTSVDPASGLDDGGYVVTVRGTNFMPGARVFFGGTRASEEDVQDCDATLKDCKSIKAVVPQHAAGKVSVQVTNLDGQSGPLPDGFEYLAPQPGTFGDFTLDGTLHGDGRSVCWGDFDNDRDPDLFRGTVQGELDSGAMLMQNNGDATYTDVTADVGLGSTCDVESCSWADYDNDGDLDLYLVCSFASNILYENQLIESGGATFVDVTAIRGVGGNASVRKTDAAWADYDLDGDLDLYLAYKKPGEPPFQPNQLFANGLDGDGTADFVDVADLVGVDLESQSERVLWGDYDNDGFADLYVVNVSSQPDVLYHNDGGSFKDVTIAAGIVEDENCFHAVWGDFNGDGFLDLFCVGDTASFAAPQRFWLNEGDGTFEERAAAAGLADLDRTGYSVTTLDKDNDGDEDIYLAAGYLGGAVSSQYDMLLENDGNNPPSFVDVAVASGIDESAYPRNGFGVGAADDDGDGDVEVYVTGNGAAASDDDYFWGNTSNANQGLVVRLIGTATNTSAVGAQVTVISDLPGTDAPTPEQCLAGDPSEQKKQVIGGSLSQNSMEVEFGLGTRPDTNRQVDCVSVFWPRSGFEQVVTRVATGHFLEIREGKDGVTVTKVVPQAGSTAGGDVVTVIGFNFAGGAQVFFDGAPATGEVVKDENTITCTTPANAAGPADVRVENSPGVDDTLPDGFYYLAPGDCLIEDLLVTKDTGQNTVHLDWSDVPGFDTYLVMRALGPRPTDFDGGFSTTVAVSEYDDADVLNDGTNYFYLIRQACPQP